MHTNTCPTEGAQKVSLVEWTSRNQRNERCPLLALSGQFRCTRVCPLDGLSANDTKWEITELNTAPLGFSAVVDQREPTMSFRIPRSVMYVSLFALATVTHAQNAPTSSNSNVKVAQGTTQSGPAEAPAKTSKSKVKKAKGGKGTGSGGPESRPPPAPAGGSGPPDPGKY
jgi:hypothetical protein